MPDLAEHHPLLDLQLRPGLSSDILNLVRKKELDAGFFIGRHPYSNVTGWPLTKLHYRVIAPPSWQEKIIKGTVKCLGRLPWIGALPFSTQHALQQEFWRKHNLRPKSVLEAGPEEDFLELVSAGLGLALARESTACAMAAAGKILVVEDALLETELSLITASESADSRLIQELHAAVIAAWQ